MKRILVFLLAGILVAPTEAFANRAISAATTAITVNSKTVSGDRRIPVQIWSDAGSDSSITIYVRLHDTAPWWTGNGMTIDDVNAQGGIWYIPAGFSRVRFAATVTTGTVHVEVGGWQAAWTTE